MTGPTPRGPLTADLGRPQGSHPADPHEGSEALKNQEGSHGCHLKPPTPEKQTVEPWGWKGAGAGAGRCQSKGTDLPQEIKTFCASSVQLIPPHQVGSIANAEIRDALPQETTW